MSNTDERAALERIANMVPAIDSIEGDNEWGAADCFRQAQSLACKALAALSAAPAEPAPSCCTMTDQPCTRSCGLACALQMEALAAAPPPQPAAIERLTDARATAWGRLYTAANSVVALAGYKGDVSTRDDELSSLMDALAGLDGGQWCPGLTPARAIERELSRVPDSALTADRLWASDEIMALNAEMGLSMEALTRLACAIAREQSRVPTTQAAKDVLAERRRQVTAEGWTAEHDDEHGHGQMALAAAVYALVGSSDGRHVGDNGQSPSITEVLWPWEWSWFKPNERRRNLVKAGALILAEIERLDRAAAPTPGSPS